MVVGLSEVVASGANGGVWYSEAGMMPEAATKEPKLAYDVDVGGADGPKEFNAWLAFGTAEVEGKLLTELWLGKTGQELV